jgi:hypothetical protein
MRGDPTLIVSYSLYKIKVKEDKYSNLRLTDKRGASRRLHDIACGCCGRSRSDASFENSGSLPFGSDIIILPLKAIK